MKIIRLEKGKSKKKEKAININDIILYLLHSLYRVVHPV